MEISSMIVSASSCSLSPFQTQRIAGPRIGVSFLCSTAKPPTFERHRSKQRFGFVRSQVNSSLQRDLHRFPEEIIQKPNGLYLNKREIGSKPPCIECQAKGATLCVTCSGSGLYVDSILESQGIIVKVNCLGCGGSGNILCSKCGGRGHAGFN
ncbi:uncharacterized protein LOC110018013 [Phalaenopsis equestris]|uniref:uncharacterized protein LOC110018013 n=1 Tax=Phalaenopsis equestris TaxID=78828 RepID=UPI0009E2C1E4|nr:uncharacterized protein LOC110018013 [Phalaenopsis equestris]